MALFTNVSGALEGMGAWGASVQLQATSLQRLLMLQT